MDRRRFLEQTGIALTAASSLGTLTACASEREQGEGSESSAGATGIGMCDWNLGPKADPDHIPRAAEATLQGLQVSLENNQYDIVLTDPALQQRFLKYLPLLFLLEGRW